ncbi:MAG TPA: MFS transporter [Anaerolineales bacterium]|nr:MFS transporter [Anaerolineales bacterium]HNN12592.1 MFS transporter [Anaerolineales bacterium]HNO31480.1 MFS transporter [Anaerolineales bacterium]
MNSTTSNRSRPLRILSEYGAQIRAFKPNARLYLLNVIITGAVMGIFRLIFNFYALSLGFDESVLGNLITTSSFVALIAALPMGYLADLLGRKGSLVLSGALLSISILAMALWQTETSLYAMNVVSGLAQSLGGVTMSPFLMENSDEKERTYLFSFGQGLQMTMASVGNWVGGYLPSWLGHAKNVAATSSMAYGDSILIAGIGAAIALLPLVFIKSPQITRSQRAVFAPFQYAAKNPGLLTKLVLPMLLTSLGAGLVMPFMNVFFRTVHHQPDPVIGTLFAWGSLAMGIGLLIAPPLAERFGKIQIVVVTQALSIPFLILLGFSPIFWIGAATYYIRLALMNMSSPVYQTFVMEHVEPSARATVASLTSMAWNFGWAFSPTISGWLQVKYGFGPPFIGTIILYTISVLMYWSFFWRGKVEPISAPAVAD